MAFDIYDVISTQLLKNTMLSGVDLTLDDGSAYPDDLFDESIKQAISVVENDLEIDLNSYNVKGERHDAVSQNRASWWSMSMDRRPLQLVDKIQITYGNYPPTDVPVSWVNITSDRGGSLSLIPTSAVLGTFSFNANLPLLIDPITNYSHHSRVPAYFSFDYKSGFNFIEGTVTVPAGQTDFTESITEKLVGKPNLHTVTFTNNGGQGSDPTVKIYNSGDDGVTFNFSSAGAQDIVMKYQIHTIPDAIIKSVLYISAMLPLDTAGDLIAGAGIAGYRIGVDGLSQEVSTTSSATNSGYGARILSYSKQLKATMKVLRSKYKSIKVSVF